MSNTCDFEGCIVLYDRLYASGRIFSKDCYKDCDGLSVPIAYRSERDRAYGIAWLENRDDGMYARCHFSKGPECELMKELINNGDLGLTFLATKIPGEEALITSGQIRAVLVVPSRDLYSCL